MLLLAGSIGLTAMSAGCSPQQGSAPKSTDATSYVQQKLNNGGTSESDKAKMREAMEKSHSTK
jgi:hypothetical protein